MPNREIFQKWVPVAPLMELATGPKCKKKKYLGPGAQGALNSELVKSR